MIAPDQATGRFRVRCEAREKVAAGADSLEEYGFRPLNRSLWNNSRLISIGGVHDQKFSSFANLFNVDGAYRFVGEGLDGVLGEAGGDR